MLIFQRQRDLGLGRDVFAFGNDLAAAAQNIFLIFLLCCPRVILRPEDQCKVRILLLEIRFEHLRRIVLHSAVRILHAQIIIQIPAGTVRVNTLVADSVVNDLLQLRVLC